MPMFELQIVRYTLLGNERKGDAARFPPSREWHARSMVGKFKEQVSMLPSSRLMAFLCAIEDAH